MNLDKLREYRHIGKTYLILLAGRAGTGKTSTANFMIDFAENLDICYTSKLSFANEVKKVAKDCFDWDGKKDEKGRVLLQNIGQTGRNYNKDIWARKTYLDIIDYRNIYDFMVIDDWRFPNELAFLKKNLPNVYIKTARLIAPDKESLKDLDSYNELSEVSLPDEPNKIYDYVIYNNGSIADLRNKAQLVVKAVMESQIKLYV